MTDPVESCIEALCRKGCRQVNQDIAAFEAGRPPPEARDLDAAQRRRVLAELKAVMAVYGERCCIDPSETRP